MKSTLARLYNYAASGGTENFTTEALAAAVRDDPTPLVGALKAIGVELSVPLARVQTQFAIDNGILDLLLTPNDGAPVAIEVKVDAGVSGDQLDRYLAWATGYPGDTKPRIVVLSRERLPDSDHVPWLPWQTLWNELRQPPAGSRWADLKTWLEERNMADDSFDPVSTEEAAALVHGHALLRKATKILLGASARMNEVWPGPGWPKTEAEVRGQLVDRFGWTRTYSIQLRDTSYKSGCTLGIYDDGDAACLSLWVWASFKKTNDRDAILNAAAGLPSPWKHDPHSGEPLRADKRLVEFTGQDEATKWLVARIDELKGAGMFELFDTARAASTKPEA